MSHPFPKAGLALAFAIFLSPAALAEGTWTGNVALSSDYVWRGVSQTDSGPAISGGVDYTNGLFYAGGWASNVDFGSQADIEVDLYAGLGAALDSGVSWNVGVIGYLYPGDEDINFTELTGGLGYAAANGVSLFADVYYDSENKNTYVEGKAAYAFTEKFSGDVTLGTYDFDAGAEYANWSVGGAYAFAALTVGLRYTDTDLDDALAGDIADQRAVLSLSKTF
jgi:uncharacterized protein (TIGR02001 family)